MIFYQKYEDENFCKLNIFLRVFSTNITQKISIFLMKNESFFMILQHFFDSIFAIFASKTLSYF